MFWCFVYCYYHYRSVSVLGEGSVLWFWVLMCIAVSVQCLVCLSVSCLHLYLVVSGFLFYCESLCLMLVCAA